MAILESFKLNNKVALVTGASRGLGQAMAIGLAEAGADIVCLSRGSACEETAAEITALSRRSIHIKADLQTQSTEDLQAIITGIVTEMGQLDILVNNAGIIRRAPAIDFNETDWDAVIQVNLKALFFLSQAAARVMERQGAGKIINIASMLSFQGGFLVPSYTAAKSGVLGLTRALANEWAPLGINVNAIAPGYMTTDNTAPLRAEQERSAAIRSRIPAGEDRKSVV